MLSLPVFADFLPGGVLFSGRIGEQWDLFLWKPNIGTGTLYNLTHSPEAEGNPIYWIQKKCFLYSCQQPDGTFSLIARDTHETIVASFSAPCGNLGWPQPSPWDDRILAVQENTTTGWTSPGIISFPNGTFEAFPVTDAPGGQAAWISPNQIFLSRVKSGNFSLVVRNLQDNRETLLLEDGRNWLSTANPLGGPPFFFARRVGQKSGIYQVLSDSAAETGWSIKETTTGNMYDWQPSVTPDGRHLVYLSLRNGYFQPILRDLDNGGEDILPITGFDQIFHPSWVPAEAFP